MVGMVGVGILGWWVALLLLGIISAGGGRGEERWYTHHTEAQPAQRGQDHGRQRVSPVRGQSGAC